MEAELKLGYTGREQGILGNLSGACRSRQPVYIAVK